MIGVMNNKGTEETLNVVSHPFFSGLVPISGIILRLAKNKRLNPITLV